MFFTEASLLIILYILLAFSWLTGIWLIFRVPRCVPDTNRCKDSARKPSVIIPARDEEKNIGQILSGLNSQDIKPLEIIVADDGSSDRTAAIAAEYGAIVVKCPPPPGKWRGKTWACRQGVLKAAGDIYLFLDADTRFTKDGLCALLSSWKGPGTALSAAPYHRTEKFYEEFSVFFNIVTAASMGAFIPGGRKKASGLFGPCLMVHKNDYDISGGHEAVKEEILEDLFMARNFKKNKIRPDLYSGKDALNYRMYPDGFASLREGWIKAFARGAGETRPDLLLAVILWLSGCAGAFIIPPAFYLTGMGSAFVFIPYSMFVIQVFMNARKFGSFRVITALLYPVHLVFYFVVFFISLHRLKTGAPVTWRGRSIKGGLNTDAD